MNPEDLMVISHRPRIESELASLLNDVPDNKPFRTRLCPPQCLARHSRFAIVDVTSLFPPEYVMMVPGASLRSLLVVGFRADDQAVLAALNLGIPTYILEDLNGATLARLLPESPLQCEPYLGTTRLAAEGVDRLLRRRQDERMLTRQELAILQLLLEGQTNRKIASALRIQPKTVRNHLTTLFEKLGVSNRLEAVAHYQELTLSLTDASRPAGRTCASTSSSRGANLGNWPLPGTNVPLHSRIDPLPWLHFDDTPR